MSKKRTETAAQKRRFRQRAAGIQRIRGGWSRLSGERRDCCLDDIIALGEDMVLLELNEECCELAQAAAKIIRVKEGRSPVPMAQARANLIEEMGDVLIQIRIAKRLFTPTELLRLNHSSREKEQRMYERLLGGKKDG